jgi:hypothetical protein
VKKVSSDSETREKRRPFVAADRQKVTIGSIPIIQMSNLILRLGDRSFSIPKKTVLLSCDLFDLHPDLYDNPSYEIETDVAGEDCEVFVNFLRTGDESFVTNDNVRSLEALAEEFAAGRLLEVCGEFEAGEVRENLIGRFLDVSGSVSHQSEVIESIERDFPQSLTEILCVFVADKIRSVWEETEALRKETDDRILGIAATFESRVGELKSRTESEFEDVRVLV